MATMLALTIATGPGAPPQAGEFERKVAKTVTGRFLVSLPKGYDADSPKRWPLMLFLHGSGERGSDVQKVAVHGPLKEVANGRDLPFIIIAPQCPENEWWDVDMLVGLLDHAERTYRVDRDRVIVTGLSMGGFGTWALALRQPGRFAAIAPVCGGGNPLRAAEIARIPTWVCHGDKDGAVNVEESRQMVAALRAAGGSPRYDEIVGGEHDVWTAFYARPDLYEWMLAQRRSKVRR